MKDYKSGAFSIWVTISECDHAVGTAASRECERVTTLTHSHSEMHLKVPELLFI